MPAEQRTAPTSPRLIDRVRDGRARRAYGPTMKRPPRAQPPGSKRGRSRGRPLTYALAALCVGAIVAAALVVGPGSSGGTAAARVVSAQQGVVQSTVSGSGNIQPISELNLGFKTGGVVNRIYVSEGQHVTKGQLLAELNPKSAEVTLEQSRASLQAAEATLVQQEQNGGETASGQGGSTSSDAGERNGASDPAGTSAVASTIDASSGSRGSRGFATSEASNGGNAIPRGSATPETSKRSRTASETAKQGGETSETAQQNTIRSETTKETAASEAPKQSAATREANLASARAAVTSDKLAVENDEQAVSDTKLYAPETGTIVSLSGEVGETVSGNGTSKTAASSSGEGASSTGAAARSSAGSARSAGGSGSGSAGSGASGSSGASSSAFAVLSNLSSMQLVVPLSESEIAHINVGQPATVTVEALEGTKLAAHVVSVALLSTTSSGVVSYDVTFQLDQTAPGLKAGMSASAEVVVAQEEGVNVPTSAISARTVTVVQGGKQLHRRVVTGLAGNSATIILSGLQAGEQVVLPTARSSSAASSILSRLGSRSGGTLGGGGIGGGGLGGGGGVFFRGPG
jgi:multidrug efflux pump subunit AcrA (membrane-fusion protein)